MLILVEICSNLQARPRSPFKHLLKLEKKFAKLTLSSICFTLVRIYEKFAGQYLAEVKVL